MKWPSEPDGHPPPVQVVAAVWLASKRTLSLYGQCQYILHKRSGTWDWIIRIRWNAVPFSASNANDRRTAHPLCYRGDQVLGETAVVGVVIKDSGRKAEAYEVQSYLDGARWRIRWECDMLGCASRYFWWMLMMLLVKRQEMRKHVKQEMR